MIINRKLNSIPIKITIKCNGNTDDINFNDDFNFPFTLTLTVSDVDSNNQMFISGCFGCRLNVWSFPSCERIHSIKACHPINCVSIEQNSKSATDNNNSGGRTILAVTCSRTGRINSFSPNVVLWNVVTGECLKKFDLPSACFVQVCVVFTT